VIATTGIVVAAESEFQDKMKEDLDGYKAQIIEGCGTTDKLDIRWEGKLGSNPRETQKGDYSSVGTLCTSGTDAIHSACINNKVVKKALSSLTAITCSRGKGTLSYSLKGGTLALKVDASYDKDNAAGQEDKFLNKLKDDLDK
jgi:hypothetical protein